MQANEVMWYLRCSSEIFPQISPIRVRLLVNKVTGWQVEDLSYSPGDRFFVSNSDLYEQRHSLISAAERYANSQKNIWAMELDRFNEMLRQIH